MHSSILSHMQDTVTVYKQAGVDRYGKSSYDSGTQYKARNVKRSRAVYTMRGERVRANGILYIADNNGTLPAIEPGKDVVEFPNGDRPQILFVDVYDDGMDMNHLRLWYGARER